MAANRPGRRFRAAYVIPVVLFLVLALALGWGLTRDPSELPSALIGKPVPAIRLPPVQGRTLALSRTHLKVEVSLVNLLAPWCPASRDRNSVVWGKSGSIRIDLS